MIRTSFIVAASLAVCTIPAVAQTAIERIAPNNTVLLVGTRNMQAMRDHLQQTPLWAIWESDSMKKMREDAIKSMGEDLDKMFEELGVEKDSLVCPSGPVGMAMFTTRNPETEMVTPAFILVADYGTAENVEKTDSIVQAALKKGEEEGEIEFDQKDIAGRTVFTIDLTKMQAKAADEFDDADMDFEMMPMPDPSEMFAGINALHYVRDGNAVLMSSDLETLTEALEGDGAIEGGITERAEFQSVMAKVGEGDMYGVLLTRDVMELMSGADPMGMAEMFKPMIRSLFGEVQGYGFSMRLNGSTAMMEQTVFAYMPNGKAGLTKLMDQPSPRAAAPAFVGPQTISYNVVAFDFSGLMDVIRTVVMSNPMLAGQVGPQLDAMAPMVNQFTSTFGKQIHWSTSASRPFGAANQQTLMAIECANQQEFENLFSGLAADMGLEARDFLGQRIYTIDPNMMAMMMPMPMETEPVSIGIGGGFLLMGPTPAVEQGLRATAEPGAATVATATDFQRAVGALSNDATVAWGYTDTVNSVESTLAVQRETIENMIRDMRDAGGAIGEDGAGDDADPEFDEFQAEFEKSLRDSMKMWDSLDFGLLRKHIGPSSWQMISTDDGFIMRAFMLGAAGE